MEINNLKIKDGSNIAIVGGGPSGSFFTYFTFELAEQLDLHINIDIIEGKDFNSCGPSGCNQCGGIVSESLIQMLSGDGIILPAEVIRQGIESYTFHLEQGNVVIEASADEQKIASMFRGLGPLGCIPDDRKSFDNHLMELCAAKGANIIRDRVIEMERKKDGIILRAKNNFEKEYDLVVGAVGLNKTTLELFSDLCPSFILPKTTRTFICEIQIDENQINKYFGNSMHVFLLNLPNIKFGALIPKARYVTLVLLGADINTEIVASFLESEPVKKCFPPNTDLKSIITCQCYPNINIKGAKSAYADRVVLIGDSSTSKLYKNGIGAAYLTAKAAANTVLFQGISSVHFKKHFQPTCNKLEKDNNIGKFIFKITSSVQQSVILKSALLRMVVNEKQKERYKRKMSSILWDIFTGSAPYKNIFVRFLNPGTIFTFVWNTIGAMARMVKYNKYEL
ncbi:MAG: hypothetical protein H8E34_07595 [Bacteroidetes bacterium]|nr:hypothetical protein [Bacteroidota bacterium]MBL6943538.1 hypothetical protein [Bacteroidales bacterium]